ncbi:hypothetical protein BH10ACI2_BH10ACI2_00240 [soil metagenome]
MNLSLARVKRVFPNFNKTAITENDFWRACKKHRIIVREIPLIVDGYYQQKRGRNYILINSNLRSNNRKWLHTAWHEFAHFLMDVPGVNEALYRRPCGDIHDPRERFADAFALICIVPFPDLLKLLEEECLTFDPDLAALVSSRIVVRAEFGE